MENLHGILGAKRATFREVNPRPRLAAIIDADPHADEVTWRSKFWKHLDKQWPDARGTEFEAAMEYWLDHNIRSLVAEHAISTAKTKRGSLGSQVSGTRKGMHTIVLKQLQMPNGKSLGECTAADCRSFGGWYSAIAKLVPNGKTVGEALTESKLRELWAAR